MDATHSRAGLFLLVANFRIVEPLAMRLTRANDGFAADALGGPLADNAPAGFRQSFERCGLTQFEQELLILLF